MRWKASGGPYGTIFATFSCRHRQKCSVSCNGCGKTLTRHVNRLPGRRLSTKTVFCSPIPRQALTIRVSVLGYPVFLKSYFGFWLDLWYVSRACASNIKECERRALVVNSLNG